MAKSATISMRIDGQPVPVSSNSYDNETWIPLIYEIRRHGVEVA